LVELVLVVDRLEKTANILDQASIDAHGEPLTDAALSAAKSADAVILGAIGGPVRFFKNI
jgi:isocitrate/isopropylmalate dehydrogenase